MVPFDGGSAKYLNASLTTPTIACVHYAFEAKKRDEEVRAGFRAMMEADRLGEETYASTCEPPSMADSNDIDLSF
jgi:hypothetical protein